MQGLECRGSSTQVSGGSKGWMKVGGLKDP